MPKDLITRSQALINYIVDIICVRINNNGGLLREDQEPAVSSGLLEELGTVGWQKIKSFDYQMSTCELILEYGFILFIEYNKRVELLPQIDYLQCQFNVNSVVECYQRACEELRRLSNFFRFLEKIDDTFATSPLIDKYSGERKILMVDRQWCMVEFNPFDYLGRPKVDKDLNWNLQSSILENLRLNFLEKDAKVLECGICSAIQIDKVYVDYDCESCKQSFHMNCMMEWVRSDPRTVKSFGKMHGSCPCCDSKLSMKSLIS